MAVTSSASIPFIFPNRQLHGMTLMDGGTIWNNDPHMAVKRCRDMGYADKDIVLDMIQCGGNNSTTPKDTVSGNAYGNYMRDYDIGTYYKQMTDASKFMQEAPHVTYRYLIFPHKGANLPSGLSQLQFTPDVTGPMIDIGKEDAKNIIAAGEGYMFKML